jgi:hypothetical protein
MYQKNTPTIVGSAQAFSPQSVASDLLVTANNSWRFWGAANKAGTQVQRLLAPHTSTAQGLLCLSAGKKQETI